MRFLEKIWPIILVIWMLFLITAVVIKLVFFSFVAARDTFSVDELMQGVQQNDSRLLEYIYFSQVHSPAMGSNDKDQTSDSDNIQRTVLKDQVTRDVIKILKKKTEGIFMECRAYDGDTLSKTLDLEMYYNWTGILMEPDPFLFPKLAAKRRNAWTLNSCLSPDSTPQNLDFLRKINKKSSNNSTTAQDPLSNMKSYLDSKGQIWRKLKIPCFPLFSVTSALSVNRIDFLILDTQGLELQILLNIPWDEIEIDVIAVNVQSIPEGPEGVKYFMSSKGFSLLSTTGYFYTFVHASILSRPSGPNVT